MLNVLLVDDEPWVLEGLRTMIAWEKYGFHVCGEALSGSEAFRMIENQRPELVITDINMPNLNGLELIEQCNRLLPKPPKFVVLSGYDDFTYARSAMRQKVAEYLLKPVDDDDMNTLLTRLNASIQEDRDLEQKRMKQQLFVINHMINRFIQGESGERLRQEAAQAMKLQEPSELQCILLDVLSSSADLDEWARAYFPPDTVHSFQDSSGRTGLLIHSKSCLDGRVGEAAIELHKQLSAHAEHPITVAVSGKGRGIITIRELYRQADEVLRAKRSQGRCGLFYFCGERQRQSTHEAHKEKLDQLFNAITGEGLMSIEECVKEFIASFAGRVSEIEAAKSHVVNLEWMLCERISELGGDPDRLMSELQLEHGGLGELADYCLIGRYVQQLCMQGASKLSELKRENESNTIFHVIQYVDREFRSKLQLQELARQFHMNATYLGQLFKKNTGQSFNAYLNGKRIEEAKKLLKRTQMKISEVALQVGYPNTDYFINKFKLSTGMLPSAYRQEAEIKAAAEPGGVIDA
ncbi:response regulator [Paenibacillus lentus]|uniref:Response regulator n=1 Tax=Paenibacillus lentus TaxID=1338368 RepID=A0A3Q8S425_9BACL|nr:response regulator [Paenibacillus lentus]AZK45720.1 response regulator [Paenibacillus lentus]